MAKSKRGFASMSKEQRSEIARKGGKKVSEDKTHMAEIGRRGGKSGHQPADWETLTDKS